MSLEQSMMNRIMREVIIFLDPLKGGDKADPFQCAKPVYTTGKLTSEVLDIVPSTITINLSAPAKKAYAYWMQETKGPEGKAQIQYVLSDLLCGFSRHDSSVPTIGDQLFSFTDENGKPAEVLGILVKDMPMREGFGDFKVTFYPLGEDTSAFFVGAIEHAAHVISAKTPVQEARKALEEAASKLVTLIASEGVGFDTGFGGGRGIFQEDDV
jgi:hypothetical protein